MYNKDKKDTDDSIDLDYYLKIFQLLPYPIIIVDNHNKIIKLNDKAYKIFDNLYLQSTINKIVKKDTYIEESFKSSLLTTEGNKYFEIKVSSLTNKKGNIDGKIIALNDLEETILNEQYSNKYKVKLLDDVNHEIRTYINGIIGMTDLTLMTNLNSEQKENLNLVRSSTSKLLCVTSDIIDFFKMQYDEIKLENVEFNFRKFIGETIRAIGSEAIDKRVELKVNIDEDIPEILIGDPTRIKQVLENIINKFISSANKGHLILSIKKEYSNDKSIRIKFNIDNNSTALDRRDLNRILKSFQSIDSKDITKKHIETRLRSVISRELIAIMNGKIELGDTIDEEYIFSFSMLLEKGKKYSSVVHNDNNNMLTGLKVKRPLNILIVDDDKASQVIMNNLFKKNGHKCEVAGNGEEALKIVKEKEFDLIFMNIQMPILDGIQTTKIIRKLEGNNNRNKPIIAVTAHTLKSDREKFLSIGIDAYMSKPFSINELSKIVYNTVNSEKNSVHMVNKQNNIEDGALFLHLL
ncbi:response regulator [Clostridium sp. DJ247]|uniref:response regulator n=1 Tax=Clostridium sp. DJ247 TaxID=2726188 RepID=UPI001626FD3A|nr:response regulator [Clostridium sp. DJ247]MBC2582204.1 response regulator [Clostridium sp. DJ247]